MAYGEQFRKGSNYKIPFSGVKISPKAAVPDLDESPAVVQQARALAKQLVNNHPSHGGPIKAFKSGALQVSVWENEGTDQEGNVFVTQSVTFERRYKDRHGEWKGTNSLKINDIPKSQVLLGKAYEYLIIKGDDE